MLTVSENVLPSVTDADDGEDETVRSDGEINSIICDVESTLPELVVPRA